MSISVKHRKLLWGRAGNICAFPGCEALLIEEEGGLVDPTVVGEEAHIVAQKPDGPRGDQDPPGGEIDGYPNLILLCSHHHTVIDGNVDEFSVDALVKMRGVHEAYMTAARSPEGTKELTDEVFYAEIVDEWTERAMLDEWDPWTSGILLSGQPIVRLKHVEQLQALNAWLVRRVWPGSNSAIESALLTFRKVLADFLNELRSNSARVGPAGYESLEIEKFYKVNGPFDQAVYDALCHKFSVVVATVELLGIELTKAANLVADTVRQTLSPRYRRREGYVAIVSGPTLEDWDKYTTLVCRYPEGTDPAAAYGGLESVRAEATQHLLEQEET